MKNITLEVTGMHCPKCKAKVENALNEIVGVASVTVSLEKGNALVECLDSTSKESLIQAVIDCGFNAK